MESREEQESSRQTVDPDIWRVFNPEGNIGRQIYESYTDEALLEAVVGTMDHPAISTAVSAQPNTSGLFETALWKYQ